MPFIPMLKNNEVDVERREYQDRDGQIVKIKTHIDPEPINYEGRCINVLTNSNKFRLNHDDMFDLASMLLEQAKRTSEYNTNHQNILAKKAKFRWFLNHGMVKHVLITHIREVGEINTEESKNNGCRYDYYTIKPIWKAGKEPDNLIDVDFSYDDMLAFPNNELDFRFSLEFFGGMDNVQFEGSYIPQPTIPDPSKRY